MSTQGVLALCTQSGTRLENFESTNEEQTFCCQTDETAEKEVRKKAQKNFGVRRCSEAVAPNNWMAIGECDSSGFYLSFDERAVICYLLREGIALESRSFNAILFGQFYRTAGDWCTEIHLDYKLYSRPVS